MKKLILIAMLLSTSAAFAQEKEFTLKVKASQVQLLGEALGMLPYNKVAPFMGELQTQINAQNEPPKVEAPKLPLPPVKKE